MLRQTRQRRSFDIVSDFRAMDPELETIRSALQTQAKSHAELGRLLGLDSSQVSRIFSGKRRLQLHEARTIRGWLGLESTKPDSAAVLAGPGMVPLLGAVGATSSGRHVIADQVTLGVVPRHPAQANLRDAFALKVSDVSMSPRYEPGEIVYLAANQWPAREQDCVLVTRQGFGYLKRYLGRTMQLVNLFQLNPEEALDFEVREVEAMHAVVGRG